MNTAEPDEESRTLWTRCVIGLLCFALPLAMPIHILINHVTHTNWSWPVSLLYPEVLGTLLVLILARRHVLLGRTWARVLGSDSSLRRIVFVAGAFVAWTAVSAVVQGAFAGYWIRSLLVGWVVPALLAAVVLALGPRARSAAWQGLSAGAGVLLAESIVLYFMSFEIPHSFYELVYINRTSRIWQGLKGGIYFGELTLGNVNDIAVFFAIAIAFASGYALDTARRSRALSSVIFAFVSAALVLEFLCYSRGVIVCLLLVLVVLTLSAVASPPLRRRRLGLLVLLFVVFFGAAFSSAASREYWLAQLRLSVGSSAALRTSMWKRAGDAESVAKEYRESMPTTMSHASDDAVIRELPRPAPADVAPQTAVADAGSGTGEHGTFAPKPTNKAPDDAGVRAPARPAATPLPRPETVAKATTKPAPQAAPAESAAPTGAADAGSGTEEDRKSAPKTVSRAADEPIAPVPLPPAPTPGPPPEAVPQETTTPAPQAVRADLAAHAGSLMRRLIFGYGLGNYGVIIGATFEGGTHNMFLDAYVASGVPGLVLFSGFWFMMLWRMGREGRRILRDRPSPPRDSIVPMPSVLLAVLVITVAGMIVNFKFETLGMMLNAAVVWLLIVTLPDRVGDSPLLTRHARR